MRDYPDSRQLPAQSFKVLLGHFFVFGIVPKFVWVTFSSLELFDQEPSFVPGRFSFTSKNRGNDFFPQSIMSRVPSSLREYLCGGILHFSVRE